MFPILLEGGSWCLDNLGLIDADGFLSLLIGLLFGILEMYV